MTNYPKHKPTPRPPLPDSEVSEATLKDRQRVRRRTAEEKCVTDVLSRITMDLREEDRTIVLGRVIERLSVIFAAASEQERSQRHQPDDAVEEL